MRTAYPSLIQFVLTLFFERPSNLLYLLENIMPVAIASGPNAAYGTPKLDKTQTIKVQQDGMKYPEYAPINDSTEIIPEIEPFEHHDRALDADPAMPAFYNDHVTVEEVSRAVFNIISCLYSID